LGDLAARGIIRFDAERQSTIGALCVPKKGDRQRLVIDTRIANCRFIEPHHVGLPTAAAMSALEVDDSDRLWMAQTDVDNAFYRLAVPSGMEYEFVLPAVQTRYLRDAGVVLSDEHGKAAVLSPLMVVLPMDFSWALYFCQRFLEGGSQCGVAQISPAGRSPSTTSRRAEQRGRRLRGRGRRFRERQGRGRDCHPGLELKRVLDADGPTD